MAIIGEGGQRTLFIAFVESRDGFMAVKWGEVVMVGVYCSPIYGLAQIKERLRGVGIIIHCLCLLPITVAGDFNAKLEECGSPTTCRRGDSLGDWGSAPRTGSSWTHA